MNYIIRAYSLQDIGYRDNQEDCFFPSFITPYHFDETGRDWVYYDGTPHKDSRLFVLCDGMGGHDRGEVASQIVTYTVSRSLQDAAYSEGKFDDHLVQKAADEALKTLCTEYDPNETRPPGTTLALLKLHADGATVAHVGDSRVYQFRPANGGQPSATVFRTQDHTTTDGCLSRALVAGKEFVPTEVEIHRITDIREGDIFLLCSDGLYENMDDNALCALITNPNYDDVERVQRLLHTCRDNRDNHTATIVRIKAILNDGQLGHSSETLLPGTVLNGRNYSYQIERLLGKGAFGNTYLVNTQISMQGPLGNILTNVKMAMKEFCMADYMRRVGSALEVVSNADIVQRYAQIARNEAFRLSTLSHPNIVRVLEVIEANNTFYYTMEYCQGGSLNDRVIQKFGLPESEAIACIRQIASAVSCVHQNHMLHLDVKPDNVMLTDDSVLKLIDFGLSMRFTDETRHRLTGKVGTGAPGFAPLEQISQSDGNEFSEATDIYSLGATYYKILTNFPPNHARDVAANGLNIQPLQAKHVSRRSIDAIVAAMRPEASQRPQTVEEFLAMLPSVDNKQDYEPNHSRSFRWLWVFLAVLAILIVIIAIKLQQ